MTLNKPKLRIVKTKKSIHVKKFEEQLSIM